MGCDAGPVRWERATESQAVLLPGAQLVLDAGNRPGVVERWEAPLPPAGDRCAGSLVTIRARGDTAWAAWWAPVAGGGIRLLVARSDDEGLNWREPVAVEPADRGAAWCDRALPGLEADTATGTLRIAYSVPDAKGWVTRLATWAPGSAGFGAAVEVVRGDSIAPAAVAASGARVVVVYAERAGTKSSVRLALLTSTGQISAARSDVQASIPLLSPPLVTLRGDRVAVAWNQAVDDREQPRAFVRTGTIR